LPVRGAPGPPVVASVVDKEADKAYDKAYDKVAGDQPLDPSVVLLVAVLSRWPGRSAGGQDAMMIVG